MSTEAVQRDPLAPRGDEVLLASRALLGVVARSMSGALDAVTLPQFRVLVILSSSEPLRMGALAARLGAVPSTFTRSIDRMVEGGWVRRIPSPDSRREVLVEATPSGERLVAEVTEQRRRELGSILSALSAADRAAVEHAFALFAEAAGEPAASELLTLGL